MRINKDSWHYKFITLVGKYRSDKLTSLHSYIGAFIATCLACIVMCVIFVLIIICVLSTLYLMVYPFITMSDIAFVIASMCLWSILGAYMIFRYRTSRNKPKWDRIVYIKSDELFKRFAQRCKSVYNKFCIKIEWEE